MIETGVQNLLRESSILQRDISIGDTVNVPAPMLVSSMEPLPDDIRDLSKYRPATGEYWYSDDDGWGYTSLDQTFWSIYRLPVTSDIGIYNHADIYLTISQLYSKSYTN